MEEMALKIMNNTKNVGRGPGGITLNNDTADSELSSLLKKRKEQKNNQTCFANRKEKRNF